MHVPSSMLNGAVCPVSLAIAVSGVSLATYCACRSKEKPSVSEFSSLTALVFAIQMLNFPIAQGTSGHIVGGVLLASLIGIPFSVLSMTLILTVQCLFFGDGGLNALGVNIINMAFISAAFGGLISSALRKTGVHKYAAVGLASYLSVIMAAAACSVEIVSDALPLAKVLPAMLGTHALIALGEAFGAVLLLSSMSIKKSIFAPLSFALALLAAFLTPCASSLPDAFTWVTSQYLPVIEDHGLINLSGTSACLAGIFLVYSLAFSGSKLISRPVTTSN